MGTKTQNLDQVLAAALWWKKLKESSNETFLPLFSDKHRYLVLMGGGGSGKSIFAGRKVLERVTSEPGHRWLVVRKVAKTLRESCFKQLVSQAWEFYPNSGIKVNKSDMVISFANGSEIIFAGLDDVEKLKSIFNITGIWIEEASELLESDFNQLDIRLRGQTAYYKQIIISFNPIFITHWLKKRFFDRKDSRVRTHHSTYKDNRFLDEEYIKVLESYKDTDEYYYTVYALGQWGVLGKSIFDAKAISRRLETLRPPLKTGFFEYDYDGLEITKIRWVDDKDGFIKIYKEPKEGYPYVIGGDTAGDGSDKFIGQVIDNITAEQVCTLRHMFDEDVYARQMFCLGMYYNEALLGVEVNFSTYPVKELERLGYKNMFVREREDTFTNTIGHAFGFLTSKVTRPLIIAGLVHIARENINLFNDEDTLMEMLTFVRDESLTPRAEAGANDDCVIASAIGYYIRPQQTTLIKLPKGKKVKWEKDQWEDYYSADEKSKKMMMEKWGNPF